MTIASATQDIEDFFITTTHEIFFTDAIEIKNLSPNSVQLILTSPPYWQIKDYGNEDQIGYNDDLNSYFEKLGKIWEKCYNALAPGCKMVINIGDQFLSAKKGKSVYQIIPLHSMLINDILRRFQGKMYYLGSINWSKVTTSNTSGGGKIMGSIYYPRNGYFFINREYIAVFKKGGKDPRPVKEYKLQSRISLENWRSWFKDTWQFPGERMKNHIAMFPEELPKRVIQMYSFVGDTVLDPFTGSGTTNKVAAELGRNSIGFEIGFNTNSELNWKNIIKTKIEACNLPKWTNALFKYSNMI
ncbi:MAG: DNA-methyltransferase [Candidatus Hodarchaeales archaeon]|jgi:site-specific DNA-methyltransferase (adenine-specific)